MLRHSMNIHYQLSHHSYQVIGHLRHKRANCHFGPKYSRDSYLSNYTQHDSGQFHAPRYLVKKLIDCYHSKSN